VEADSGLVGQPGDPLGPQHHQRPAERAAEQAFDRLNPEFAVPADRADRIGHRDVAQREAALAVPGGARRNLTARRAAGLLAQVAPTGAPAVTRWQLAGELVADVHQLEQRIAAVEARIKAALAQSKTSLLGLFGVGPVLAATNAAPGHGLARRYVAAGRSSPQARRRWQMAAVG